MAKKKAAPVGTAVIYARYSSHAQREESIEQQVAEARAYAAANGYTVSRVYSDSAISGRTDQRPDFQRMMRAAEKKEFRYVIAWKSNRMGRDMLNAMINEARLNEMGIRCLYVEEDFDDSAAGRFALRSMMNVNQFYSEAMAEDIRRGLRDNAMNCKITNGHLPYGYKKGPDGRYAIDEPRAAVVREIFARVAGGEPYVDIREDLNARGITTGTGRPWARSSFEKILSNERYRGIYIYDDIRVEGGIPAIVPDALYCKVQEVISARTNVHGQRRGPNGDFLLTGKLHCGECGAFMTGVSGTGGSGQRYYYYACRRQKVEKDCDKIPVPRDQLEQAVASAIRELLTPEFVAWMVDAACSWADQQRQSSEIALLEQELTGVSSSIDNILRAIEQGIFTSSTRARLQELEERRAQLTDRLTAARADLVTLDREDLIAGLLLWRDGDYNSPRFLRRLFDTFIRRVDVFDDRLQVYFSFCGDQAHTTVPLSLSPPGDVLLSSATLHQTLHRRTADGIVLNFGFLFVFAFPLGSRK